MTFTSGTIKQLQSIQPPLSADQLQWVLDIMESAKLAAKRKKPTPEEREARGKRMSEDWKLPRSWGEYGLSLGMTRDEVRDEAEQFRNYWLSASGPSAIKLNWFATWRNRCLAQVKRWGRKPNPLIYTASDIAPEGTKIGKAQWEAVLRVFSLTHSWDPNLGPAPGRPGCRVPAELLPQAAS